MKLDDFIGEIGTRKAHSEGAKLPLANDQYLLVAGSDSDVSREVLYDVVRLDVTGYESMDEMRKLYARLVIGWSFDDKFSVEYVAEKIFKESPKILDAVVEFSRNNANFTNP